MNITARALRIVAVALPLGLAVGCHTEEKKQAEQKQMQQQVEQRAQQLATEQTTKALQDEQARRDQDAKRAADAKEELRQKVLTSPAPFFEVTDVQMGVKGSFRHMTSVSVTNKSQFAVTDPRGSLDFHGDVDRAGGPGGSSDVVATSPVQLTGSIAPGASMIFTEKDKTLTGTPLQVPKPPTQVTFRVTGLGSVGEPEKKAAAPADGAPTP